MIVSRVRALGLAIGVMALFQTAAGAVLAQEAASDWADYGQGRVRLVSATTGASGDELLLGLQYDIAPGWEIYWRTPGEAGFPTTIKWDGSDNLADPVIQWPAPRRFQIFGLDTLGYANEVVLPIAARVPRPDNAVLLRATSSFLTCREICVPHDIPLSLDLPGGGGISQLAGLINRYQSQVPKTDPGFGLSIERSEIVNGPEGRLLQVVAWSEVPFSAPDIYVEGPQDYTFSPSEVRIGQGGLRAVLQVPISFSSFGGGPDTPNLLGGTLRLTLVDGSRAVEQVLPTTLGQAETASFLPLATILLLALLGGLILNVMPCVLPVLSLKLMGLVSHGGGERGPVRRSFLASSAGILFAFLVLATMLVALRSGGVAIGWGIQFQQPLFIIAMVVVITLFTANTWGFFEFAFPQWVSGLAVRGGGAPRNPYGLGNSFGGGVFATILATPCSAPFLGTAIGFALARGPGEIYAIFAALGIGMAAPFLLVAAAPALATKLPRPGAWMVRVKQALGLALAGTAVWLLTILAFQVSILAASFVALLMAAVLVVLWGRRFLPAAARLAPAAIAVLAVVAFASPQLAGTRVGESGLGGAVWQPFDEAAIPGLVQDGKIVFVDVTAEWCVTCIVNKKLVLDRGETARVLRSDNVVAMQADWTNPDEAIAGYLARNNRFGIPFNIIYGPVAPNGLILPELLKEKVVMETFNQAAGRELEPGA